MKATYATTILNEFAQPLKSLTIDSKNFVLCEHAINADNALVRQNKNLQTSISFEIARTFKNEREAQMFAMTHAQTLNTKPMSTLSFANLKTNDVFLKIDNAVISSVKTSVQSHLTTTKYTFLGSL